MTTLTGSRLLLVTLPKKCCRLLLSNTSGRRIRKCRNWPKDSVSDPVSQRPGAGGWFAVLILFCLEQCCLDRTEWDPLRTDCSPKRARWFTSTLEVSFKRIPTVRWPVSFASIRLSGRGFDAHVLTTDGLYWYLCYLLQRGWGREANQRAAEQVVSDEYHRVPASRNGCS